MEHGQILRRAWHMVRHYRALWIFGIFLALTTTSWQAGFYGSWDGNDERPYSERGLTFTEEEWRDREYVEQEMREYFRQEFERDFPGDFGDWMEANKDLILTIAWIAAGVGMALLVVTRMVRYVSEVSLVRMVDDYEDSGEQDSRRQGWSKGWSRAAWRLFLIDLSIDLPAALALTALFALAVSPAIIADTNGNGEVGLFALVITIGLVFLVILLAIIVVAGLQFLKHFMRRSSVLDGLGVFASIREGYGLVRAHLKDTGLMWLIVSGVRLVFPVLLGVVALALAIVAIIVGGLPALLLNLLVGEGVAIGFAVLAAVLVIGLPLLVLTGLLEVFASSAWTLTFRELRASAALDGGGA